MESEESQGGSSGNESCDEGCQSSISTKSQEVGSVKSNRSQSRSSSPESRVQSALSEHSQGAACIRLSRPHSAEEHNSEQHSDDDSDHSLNVSQHSLDSHHDEQCNSPTGKEIHISSSTTVHSSPVQQTQSTDMHRSTGSNHSSNSLKRNSGIDEMEGKMSPEIRRLRSRSTSEDEDGLKSLSNYNVNKLDTDCKARSDLDISPQHSSKNDSPRRRPPDKDQLSDDDNESIKSDSSVSSRSISSRGSHRSQSSVDTRSIDSTRKSSRSRKKSESSISSESTTDLSHNKSLVKSAETHAEEISDGDMESDPENDDHCFKEEGHHFKEGGPLFKDEGRRHGINISHEDLSDVSDLEESLGGNLDNDDNSIDGEVQKVGISQENKTLSPDAKQMILKNKAPEEGEEQLDFEAEDGECGEIDPTKEKDDLEEKSTLIEDTFEKFDEKKEAKELEEGEVTDEDDVRPEETEPRPVCRFFSRGQCTWGASCRFLHPGVTDKGNYTMFELIRPVVPGEFGRDERMYGKPEPPLIESAWERGLRTAKEMLRKSVKRKEQDIDFEEKKMNLSLAQEEYDKENGYYGRVPSPEPRYVRHIPSEYPVARPTPEEYYGRRQMMYEPEYAPMPPRERVRTYRELPTHRMPDYYGNKYEEEPPPSSSTKRSKPKREVIVQRVEERQGRGDEWSDPWMRSKSPAGRRKDRKRSYSSGSSYSSSSSSRSSSDSSRSTYRSRSHSSHRRRRSRSRRSRQVSPSVIVSERKAANERAALMNPPAPKRRAPSPGMMRVSGAANPPAPSREDLRHSRSKLAAALARVKGKGSSRSSSGSSGSSSSDSDSSDSSSSSSRDESSPRRPGGVELSIAKAMDALKSGGLEKNKIKLNLKNPVGLKKSEMVDSRKVDQAQGKKRTANSPPPGDPKSKKATSRREELLKQLKAVEDAIAKKRSKVI